MQLILLWKDGILIRSLKFFEAVNFLVGRPGLLRKVFRDYLDYYKADFHPWQHDNRHLVENWKQHFADLALARHSQIVQITQNVDNLLERAGCPEANVIHLHGTIGADLCHRRCGYREKVDLKLGSGLHDCPQCGGQMRPAVVWFGETLPEQKWLRAENHCRNADCLLVIGTSAQVQPAASLIHYTKQQGGKVIVINTQKS